MTMTTDAASSRCGSTLERVMEIIAMAQGTQNKIQAKLTNKNREIKATTQARRSFAKVLKNSQVQSLAIRCDNSTAVFDTGKRRASISLIKEIKQVHQTIEKLGILIQITFLPRVKNKGVDVLSRLSRAGDYKLKEKIFSIEISVDELEPNSRLILTTLQQHTAKIHVNNKSIRRSNNQHSKSNMEDGNSIDSSTYSSLSSSSEENQRRINKLNDSSSTMARNNEILEPGTSLIKKNLKLKPGKIQCLRME
ncbi:MAG: hypothetical protein EZS28_023168 [Streblomastix strix]|uniref:Uncharacterized protein n=1 Tax=Streblomastix strix TaxID=222440 RepID=A0A5J4VFH3_9EUKA|nr:MAG: hypothetical protein EZS28_023168 [Streblomastix strix]